jgi:hypothetical protein
MSGLRLRRLLTDGSDKVLTHFNSDLNTNMGGQEEGGELSCCGEGDYEANQVPVKKGTCFTYYLHSNVVCLPVNGTCSGFSSTP